MLTLLVPGVGMGGAGEVTLVSYPGRTQAGGIAVANTDPNRRGSTSSADTGTGRRTAL